MLPIQLLYRYLIKYPFVPLSIVYRIWNRKLKSSPSSWPGIAVYVQFGYYDITHPEALPLGNKRGRFSCRYSQIIDHKRKWLSIHQPTLKVGTVDFFIN
jgi:hypothetical protein